ncbi:MAG: fibrobacter succinogenes major paralogous domain-containing protein [Fibrobacter sp.]|nr:fibrobacter succinogenes major paralogous domain-containing protein [Fibrobacter sp.]
MKHLGFLVLAFTVFLAACGDDTSSSPVDDPDSSAVESSAQSSSCDDAQSSSSDKQGNSSSDKQNASSSSESAQSSSGDKPSSSSGEGTVSSSSQMLTPSVEIVYGTLMDERDGKTYKTVVIGKQTWMAENINYETRYSFCYDNKAENCAKYGRLYIWEFAMQACPAGWGLPSLEEFQALVAAVGGDAIAGKALKSTEGWKDGGNGTDDYGFAALPAGYMKEDSTFHFVGEFAKFWSTSGTTWKSQLEMSYDRDSLFLSTAYTEFALSVRCLKGAGAANETKALPCKTDSTDTCEYGSVKDDRDGRTYKTVKIGDQWWMAQNLNYETENSFCADDSACAKNGRFYTWAAAMDSAAKWSEGGKGCGLGSSCSPKYPVRGVCPSGWHVPSKDEWTYLRTAVKESGPDGKMLKSVDGWIGGFVEKGGGLIEYDSLAVNGKGTDAFGFTALPVGIWDKGALRNEGFETSFWSSSEYEYDGRAHHFYLSALMDNAMMDSRTKNYGHSVRCVKDAD